MKWEVGCWKSLSRLLAVIVAFQLTVVLFVFPVPYANQDVETLMAETLATSKLTTAEKPTAVVSEQRDGRLHDEILPQNAGAAAAPSEERALANAHVGDRRPTTDEIRVFEAKLPLIGVPDPRHKKCTPARKCLVHLHIGKNGGTSLDKIGGKMRTSESYVGGKHFDWSYILGKIGKENADVILMLRDPVSRSLSHFYFTQQVYGSPKIKSTSLSQFLKDPQFLLEERGIWQDGQAAVSWLTGTHIANWCAVPAAQVPLREELSKPSPELLHLAADRLEQSLWFGIIEDLPRSMELLQHTLGLAERPAFPHSNKGRKKPPQPPTEEERALLENLMPMDRWLYSYGKLLFEARWDAYQQNRATVVLPERPPYPDIPCWSTRFELNCDRGPLKGSFVWTPEPPKKPVRTASKRFQGAFKSRPLK